MNLYPELVQSGAGKNSIYLKRTPGIVLFCTITGSDGPIRGLWAGENRLFAVAGSHLYEIFSDATFHDRGSVGNDSANSPVQFAANGNQLLITSAGLAYCDNGSGPVVCTFNTGIGAVNTDGSAVTWISGAQFDNVVAGNIVLINSVVYKVASVDAIDGSYTSMTLTTSAGTQSNVVWEGYGLNGKVNGLYNGTATDVYLVSGDPFDPGLVGQIIVIPNIGGHNWTVTSWVDAGHIVVSGLLAGVNIPYGASIPVAAGGCAFLDGYFIVFKPGSKQINLSQLFDGTTWDGLDYAIKEGYPDNIAMIQADHEQLWIHGDEMASEIWQDVGAADFPLQRAPGGFIQYACLAPATAVRFFNGVAWLGGDQIRGGPVMWFAQSFEPVRISDHAVESEWANYGAYNDAITFPYIDHGHHFLCVHFPTADRTWAYDASIPDGAGTSKWHERGHTSAGVIHRQLQTTHGYVALGSSTDIPYHYVGDSTASPAKIYRQAESFLSDAGVAITRQRTFPHLGTENLYTYFGPLELIAGVPGGVINPVLDYSRDYGANFVNPQSRTSFDSSLPNPSLARMIWRRLGKDRDRVFRITITDIADFALVDAYYDAEVGL